MRIMSTEPRTRHWMWKGGDHALKIRWLGWRIRKNPRVTGLMGYISARLAITKYHKLDGLNRNLMFHSLGCKKFQKQGIIRVHSIWGLLNRIYFILSSSFWWFVGSLWCSLVCTASLRLLSSLSHSILILCMSVSSFPLFMRTPDLLK